MNDGAVNKFAFSLLLLLLILHLVVNYRPKSYRTRQVMAGECCGDGLRRPEPQRVRFVCCFICLPLFADILTEPFIVGPNHSI